MPIVTPGNPAPSLRPPEQRRTPPDRGIVLLEAKGRIGPHVWALYGRVEKPVILKDDLYLDNSLNEFYRDSEGQAFILLPYLAESESEADDVKRMELADAAYRRAIALGVTERPEIFFSCVYQFQVPDYRCVAIHSDRGSDILQEDKCLRLIAFEQARLKDQLAKPSFHIESGKKIQPLTIRSAGEPSNNLLYALNTLVIHHGYTEDGINALWSGY